MYILYVFALFCFIFFNPLKALFCIPKTSNEVKHGAKEIAGSGRLALPLRSRNKMTNPKFAVTLGPAIWDEFTKVMLCFTKQSLLFWLRKIHWFYNSCGCDFQGKSQYYNDICPLHLMVTSWLRSGTGLDTRRLQLSPKKPFQAV